MDFSKLPFGAVGVGAGLALLLASALPLRAEPAQEIKRSIDEAGTAVNRQLGEWLGVTPEKPARRKVSTKPKANASIPLPRPRPQDIDAPAQSASTAAEVPTPTPRDVTEAAGIPADTNVSPPVTLAPPVAPVEPPPSRRAEPTVAAVPTPQEKPAEQAKPAAPERAEAPVPRQEPAPPPEEAAAAVPLPTPGPERQIAALPPVPPSSPPPAAEPQPAVAVPTICPELSNENLGVFTPVAVTATNTACTVDRGVSLSAVRMKDGRLVTLEPAATLRCEMAAAVARWVRNGIEPAVATLGAPLDKVMVAASQQCRPRNRVPGAKISEHGRGNALDTGGYVLKDGRRFVIGIPAAGSADKPMPVAFQELLKASACTEFTTILGPGSDGYHEQHLHVDRAQRRSGAVLCQWAVAEAVARAPSPPKKPPVPAATDDEEGGEDAPGPAPDTGPAAQSPGTSQ
ncbi:extensin family protein [Ancylobacter sp.]|uniref:extensin family protein n=1 Tax=Ancylobacter sp. TaxID=1872567 RepID=UPI003D0CB7F9